MSGFDFGLQFLNTDTMTYWGERQDANFWIENAECRVERNGSAFPHGCTSDPPIEVAACTRCR